MTKNKANSPTTGRKSRRQHEKDVHVAPLPRRLIGFFIRSMTQIRTDIRGDSGVGIFIRFEENHEESNQGQATGQVKIASYRKDAVDQAFEKVQSLLKDLAKQAELAKKRIPPKKPTREPAVLPVRLNPLEAAFAAALAKSPGLAKKRGGKKPKRTPPRSPPPSAPPVPSAVPVPTCCWGDSALETIKSPQPVLAEPEPQPLSGMQNLPPATPSAWDQEPEL